MKLLLGQNIADEKYEALKIRAAELQRPPALAVIMVGEDVASKLYITLKEKAAKKSGIDFHKYFLSEDVSQEEVMETITFLRQDTDVDGIVIQLPLADHLDQDGLIEAIGAEKDVDGFHPENIKRYMDGERVAAPPVFPTALVELALSAGKDLQGLQAVIIGRSDIFTKAMVACCTRVGLRVQRVLCEDIEAARGAIASCDVVFSACGHAGLLAAEDFKEGAIIIDGGIAYDEKGKVVGDVLPEGMKECDVHISPVPGGVGPVTVATLLENVVAVAHAAQHVNNGTKE